MNHIPLIILYAWWVLSTIMVACKDGQPRPAYNFYESFSNDLFMFVLIWWALGWRFI